MNKYELGKQIKAANYQVANIEESLVMAHAGEFNNSATPVERTIQILTDELEQAKESLIFWESRKEDLKMTANGKL